MVYDADMVSHELSEADGDNVDEPNGLSDPLLQLDTDGLKDDDAVGDDESVVEIVCVKESVPDPDCDIDRVPQGDVV